MFFQGPLPAETVDETAVTRESRRLKAQDPLSDGETVKALVVCGSKKPPNCKWYLFIPSDETGLHIRFAENNQQGPSSWRPCLTSRRIAGHGFFVLSSLGL